MLVAFIILNYNGAKWLPDLLADLSAQRLVPTKVYLVDNGSQDGSVEYTERHHPEVAVLRNGCNLGYSMAYNLAMRVAIEQGCDWAVWANTDIRLEPGCLEQLLRAFDCDSSIGIVGPAFMEWGSKAPNRYMTEVHRRSTAKAYKPNRTAIEVEWVEGSLLLIRKSCWEDVGPLDPSYFFYWEEVDYCRRARYRGWKVALAPMALARHFAGGSTETSSRSRFELLKARNQYVFTLTDPASSWYTNIIRALHLMLVRLKGCRLSAEWGIGSEARVLWQVCVGLRPTWQKWRRDKNGQRPPPFQAVTFPIEVKIPKGRLGDGHKHY